MAFNTDASGGPGIRKNVTSAVFNTTTAAAGQVAASYTPSPGKFGFLEQFSVDARLTTYAATATAFGQVRLVLQGVTLITFDLFGVGFHNPIILTLQSPIVVPPGQTLQIQVDPAALANFTWTANLNLTEK